MLKILSISATLSFLLVSSAMAQSDVGACAADIKKVCANIEPGNLRIATCVKEHGVSGPLRTRAHPNDVGRGRAGRRSRAF